MGRHHKPSLMVGPRAAVYLSARGRRTKLSFTPINKNVAVHNVSCTSHALIVDGLNGPLCSSSSFEWFHFAMLTKFRAETVLMNVSNQKLIKPDCFFLFGHPLSFTVKTWTAVRRYSAECFCRITWLIIHLSVLLKTIHAAHVATVAVWFCNRPPQLVKQ